MGLLAAVMYLLTVSSASAFTLLAPIKHDWTFRGSGLRGYPGGYTEVAFGSYRHGFHLSCFTIAAGAVLVVGGFSAFAATAIRGFVDEAIRG
jgi:hypothetical protein